MKLWMLAAEAAAVQGVKQTARALQLSPERLEQWCQQLGLTGPSMRILVATQPVDFRKGIDGLAAICRQQLQEDPMTGCAFIFRNR